MKKYALRFDGFLQYIHYDSIDDVREAYKRAVKNTLLYEYDCAVVEIVDGKVVRTVSFEELK